MSGSPQERARFGYIDNLRSTMIVWVVAFHTAITYSHIGAWYYSDPAPVDQASSVIFLTLEVHSQAFFMGLLFLLAGYFVPGAFDRKGFGRFMTDRFVRLGVPSLIYIFAVQPLMLHYLLHYGSGGSLADYYRGFLASRDWLTGAGPMWFAIALLIFSLIYGLFRTFVPGKKRPSASAAPGLAALMAAGLLIAVFAFLIRIVEPMGANVLYFQPAFFAQYIALFAAGIVAYRNDWLARLPTQFGYRLLAGAAILGPAAWFALLVLGGGLEKGIAPFIGGWHWQSAGYALWESLFCMAFSVGLIVLYRERFNGSGRLSKLLSANSFGIYFLHPPVVVAVSQAFIWLALPPLVKWLVVVPLAFLAALAIVHLVVRRMPLLRRIV